MQGARADQLVVEANKQFDAGQTDAAEDLVKRALKADEVHRGARFLLGKICYKKAAVAASPDEKISLLRTALSYISGYGRARKALNEALSQSGIDPLKPEVRVGLAQKLQEQGKYAEADAELNEIWRLDGDKTILTAMRNSAKLKMKLAREIERWKSVLACSESAEGHDGLAKAYEDNGDKALALKEFERACELNSHDAFASAGLKRLSQVEIAKPKE